MQLQGIRVVDLSRILSGPFCSMFLADMGAEVIKIEDVDDGDPVRKQGHLRNGFSLYFASFNRNKRSLTLDLRSAEGKAVLRRLIATADVVLDNFRPGVMEKIGLSRAELAAIKPDIVSCHITGFGMDGPYRDRPVVRLHRAGDERLHERQRRGRRAAGPRGAAAVGPHRGRLRGDGHLRGAGAPRTHGPGRGSGDRAHRQHDRQPRVPRDALFRDRRAAAAHRQRPRAGRAVRPVRGRRRRSGDRAVERPDLLQAARRAGARRAAHASGVPHQPRPLRAPRRRSTRSSTPRSASSRSRTGSTCSTRRASPADA